MQVFKALASPTRIKILKMLLTKKACATDICSCIKKDLSTISRHLQILQSAGLIDYNKIGKKLQIVVRHPAKLKKLLKLAESWR